MDERDSLMRGSVFAAAGASVRGSGRSGLVRVTLAGLSLLAGGSAVRFRGRANGNFRPIQKLVEAVHRYHFLRFKTLYGGHRSIGSAGRNRPNGGGLVTFNRVDKRTLGVALYRLSRNQSHIVLGVDKQLHVHELAREKSVILVVENGFELQSSGSRVDDIIETEQRARCQLRASFAIEGVHCEFLPLA